MNDAAWAALGRDLADALMRFAHERGDAEKKRIAELHTEMCRARRDEIAEAPQSPDDNKRSDASERSEVGDA